MRIGRYLLSTKDRGMIYRPDPKRGLEVFVDANFAGGWDPEDAKNADNVYSCTGYVICYAGCAMFWQSKLQTEIALSMADSRQGAAFDRRSPSINGPILVSASFPPVG